MFNRFVKRKFDLEAFIAIFRTAGALLIGNSVLVLLGVIGTNNDEFRLRSFIIIGIIGVIFAALGCMIKKTLAKDI